MPSFKKGLSRLDRLQAGLSGKQIRRSMNEINAQKSKVDEKIRGAFIAQTATPPQTAEKSKKPETPT